MDWTDRMNAAVDYIEGNLAGEINMAAAARLACCSEYHFTRFFSYIADLPLNEYIRRRRLTMAGFALQKSTTKIIDVATQFGYDSPNSFTRAFQAMHGVTPSEARASGVALISYPRINFAPSPRQPESMNWRITTEGAFTVFGVSCYTTFTEAFTDIPEFIDRCEEARITNRIVKEAHGDGRTCFKSVMWDTDDGMLQYMLCLDLPAGGVSEDFMTVTVPARTWAVFPLIIERPGEDSIISVWKRIWTDWFPGSGYEQDTGPRQERCYWRDEGKMVVEAWVPIVKATGI